MTLALLPILSSSEVMAQSRSPVPTNALVRSGEIVEEVRRNGISALRKFSKEFGDLEPDAPLVYGADDILQAEKSLDPATHSLLGRAANRILSFARAQFGTIGPLDIAIEGGRAGHNLIPVASVGAYAPGGRHPLPSTVLMTVIPARVAGVKEIWVASPRPTAVTLAAASISGANGLISVGGAQAIAALAFGTTSPKCDMIVGPGNIWVTAAKKYLYGEIGIDGLAGPSEIVVIADNASDPRLVAADLLAQSEHDPLARPMLVVTDPRILPRIQAEIAVQVVDLSTANEVRAALDHGFGVVAEDLEQAIAITERIAPEHLALHVPDAHKLLTRLSNYGSVFVGDTSAEAMADYGAGPNHVLPTGGGARYQSGLSVFTFLKAPTWLAIDDPDSIGRDAADLGRIEGLIAHSRAAEFRRQP